MGETILMKMLIGLAAATVLALGAGSATAADPKRGKEIFSKVGCWGCHGYNGQGATAVQAPKIAPDPMPLEALITFLRKADRTLMPPYDAKGLPDADVADIHAWLASQPKPADWKTNPLLQP